MESFFLRLLYIYLGFVILAVLLTLLRRQVKPKSSSSNIWQKYPLYIILNIIFLVAAFSPHDWHATGFLMALIGCAASWELSHGLRLTKTECIILPVVTAGMTLSAEWLQPAIFIKIWLVIMLASAPISGLNYNFDNLGRRILGLVSCFGYLPLCLATFVWISQTDKGYFGAILVYGTIAINDAFAQIIGELVGRHMLTHQISPGKTVEGAAGGIILSAIFGAILCPIVGWSYWQGAVTGMLLGFSGLIGDLTVSSWKRALQLKDFSHLLGAHGGVLDRFDAFVLAAPIFFIISKL